MLNKATKAIIRDKKNKYLFQLRDNLKEISSPNKWGFFGGKVKKGERPSDSMIRELKEELNIRKISRKSITLKGDLRKDTKLKLENIIMKRPGLGITGNKISMVIGKKLRKNLSKNYQIKMSDLYK